MNSATDPFSHANLPQLLRDSSRLTVASPSVHTTTQADLAESGGEPGSHKPGFFDQINLDEALQIYSVVRGLAPDNTMEIGFCCGGSGLAILQALEDVGKGLHHAVDPYQSTYAQGQGRHNVQIAGLAHRLRFYESFPENVISEIPRLQFAFIDASHLYDLSMLDFVLADKRLDVGGVLALHDLWMPSLQKLVRYILANRHYETLALGKQRMPGSIQLRFRLKKVWGELAARLPFLNGFLTPELIKPWSLFEASNLMLLRKIKEDDRDWRFHRKF